MKKKLHTYLTWVILPFIISMTLNHSHAEQTQPNSKLLIIHQWIHQNKAQSLPITAAAFLCFIAASISSAGGIGGGGLFIPILTIVAGLDLKTASSFSAFMVTGGSIASVGCNFISGKNLIDYDIALLMEPCMLLGVSVGVICNIVFPEWLITALFAVFLAWCTFKTCKSAVGFWVLESEEMRRNKNGLVREEACVITGAELDLKEPLLIEEGNFRLGIPWMKLAVLILVWFSFFAVYLLRGNREGQSITSIEPCGAGYWILSSLQIPLAMVSTTWILNKKGSPHDQTSIQQGIETQKRGGTLNKLTFPIMALLAGVLGGVFGIGGGMLISPLLLQVGISPEVTAATCSFMVFFSSSMSACQYLLLRMKQIREALILASSCFIASAIGLVIVQRAIERHGRASLIVFSVGTVMALSTVLITSFGALDIWRDYITGNYMGFKLPC